MAGGWLWRLRSIDEVTAFEDSKSTKTPEDSTEDSEGSNILNGESSESSGEMESSQEGFL